MRVPLAVTLESRDGTTDQDAKVVNGIIEVKGEQSEVRKRPGLADVGLVKAGTAQLLYAWNGLRAVLGEFMNAGTINTIVSAPTQTDLNPANDGNQYSAQETSNDAATPRLFFHNGSEGWVMTRAGAISDVTFGDSLGPVTYTLLSLTRSGTTATATMAEDAFNVGDSVTIAGAGEAAYNGAQTVTAITSGSFTPAIEIPITITRSSTTATATTVSGAAHGLTNGVAYTISGADQSDYNGSKTITVSASTPHQFTYTVSVSSGTTITLNPSDKDSGVTLSGGDLTATCSATAGGTSNSTLARATAGKSTGKWYFEVTASAFGSGGLPYVGVGTSGTALTGASPLGDRGTFGYIGGLSPDAGDVIGVAIDFDNDTVYFYRDNVLTGSAALTAATTYYPMVGIAVNPGFTGTGTMVANFGASAFTYTPPSGYAAYQSDTPQSPATGNIIVTNPAVTVNPTFSYTVAGSPATPATGTITAVLTSSSTVGNICPGVAYLNGYFFIMDTNGVIWGSASDDPTSWDALNFVTAQNENGYGKAIAKSQSYVIAFKEWSTEFFYDAQNETGSPLSPVESGFTKIGCASGFSVADVEGNLLWISQTRATGRGVYLMQGLQQVKVSTPDVDRILNDDSLATVYAYGLNVDGHALYILTLTASDITLVYDLTSKTWCEWRSYTEQSSATVSSASRTGFITTITLTATTGNLKPGAPIKVMLGVALFGTFHIIDSNANAAGFGTSFSYLHEAGATPPANGDLVYPYAESYFKFTKAASVNGVTYLLHESNGHLYTLSDELYRDAGLPIRVFARTTRMDGGTTAKKKLPALRLIGDNTDGIALVRWSDDDCETFSEARVIDLDSDEPETRRCGAFKRRTFEIFHVENAPLRLTAMELDIK